jgi:hypothetical protein
MLSVSISSIFDNWSEINLYFILGDKADETKHAAKKEVNKQSATH